ncbi:RNA polymerase II transcription factor B subunit 4 isoform X2 [Arachis ipaensis]|uniref:RNA polymerase II transcription factor B subunit 4 isoform X2 n=1 Tax=Arachis ipaensis TaxID=130454 RepID=UPI000A2B1065|nr:RNA polymerase II transcription factor B subunit 4 isoform X2 [Arachis ipaensis]
MPSAPSKLYSDDVSLLVVTLDTNPFFWSTFSFPFSEFLSHVLAFLNSILLLSQLNQVVVIATGCNSCTYLYDSSSDKNHGSTTGSMPSLYSDLLHNLEVFLAKDQHLAKPRDNAAGGGAPPPSLLSGSLSMALCYIQRAFRSGPIHPQPRILCLQGSADGPEQYVAIMNSIFSAQHSTASYITGGIYYRPPHLDGLFQYFSTVFATDLHSRAFLRLPKSVGVDFRASCFCHKQTIDMGYVCSVCLSIFCEHHDKCSTCGSVFGQAQSNVPSSTDRKRKA